jgi:hypothetical protein
MTMLKHRDALFNGVLGLLLLAAPAFGQTGNPDAPPAPSTSSTDHPKTPHGATWPHSDPGRQREETTAADRARKSGEMGYRRDSGSDTAPSGSGETQQAPANPETGGDRQGSPNREQSRTGGEPHQTPAQQDKARTGDRR